MGLLKKNVADRGLTWGAAVPRRSASAGSTGLSQRIDDERLIAEGRMHPAGLEAYAHRA